MNGNEILDEIARRIKRRKGTKSVSDSILAKEIGVTLPALVNYRKKRITAKQVVNLMEKHAKRAERHLISESITPIIEFYPLDPIETKKGKSVQIFPVTDANDNAHPYYKGLKKRLDCSFGIYVFHDSRGRAIYAGKAQKQSLWKEINNAFNRDRGEIQNIKRVKHPTNKVQYREPDEITRRIAKDAVALSDIAAYASAYEVPYGLIGKFEALIIRTFANDLLNVRMENF